MLRRRLLPVRARTWASATAAGAGLSWMLGMIPSLVMALTSSSLAPAPSAGLPRLLRQTLGCALGLPTGPVLDPAQWVVWRAHSPNAVRCLRANALAWAIGVPLISPGMDAVPWTKRRPVAFLVIYAARGTVGLVVGAIHGRILVRLEPRRLLPFPLPHYDSGFCARNTTAFTPY